MRTHILMWSSQAAHQAAQEKKAEVQEASQAAGPPPAAEAAPESPARKLPVGNAVSSIHVNYDYFAVGTGQVSVMRFWCIFACACVCVFRNQNEGRTAFFCRCQLSITLWTLSQWISSPSALRSECSWQSEELKRSKRATSCPHAGDSSTYTIRYASLPACLSSKSISVRWTMRSGNGQGWLII